jgi:hypothetical protein
MTPQQSTCTAQLKLGEDGVWFCPQCGLRLELPPPRRGGGGKRRELNQNAVGDCADRSGPYSNPID